MNRWIAWNVFFRVQEWAKKHPTFRILREMEAADSLTATELQACQDRKLRDLISYCYEHVPHVRDQMRAAGIAPAQIRCAADLPRLPLTAKGDIRRNREGLRSNAAGKLASFSTGGSTGEPLIFDIANRRVAARVACRQRVSQWWGVSVGDPELAIWGSPVEVTRQDWVRGVRDFLLSTRLLPAFEMNETTISRYLDVLEKRPCVQLFGYPSSIYQLCLQAQREGRRLRNLGIRAVFVTGEVLFPYQRELISEMLNAPVANGYGGRDSGFIAHECPQGGMHILADAVVVEIVDGAGRPVEPGETGEIVVTDLYSHEAPFIRYSTGDLGVCSRRRCACGRALPLMEHIEGRSNDAVLTPDGRLINSLALIYAVREVEGIEHFRVRQKTINSFHVQVVTSQSYLKKGEQHIRDNWTKLLRSAVIVEFEYLAALPPERSGKFRHVISDLDTLGTAKSQEAVSFSLQHTAN